MPMTTVTRTSSPLLRLESPLTENGDLADAMLVIFGPPSMARRVSTASGIGRFCILATTRNDHIITHRRNNAKPNLAEDTKEL